MFVYDLLDGGVVFVESGGEGYPVAGGFDLVDKELGSGVCGLLFPFGFRCFGGGNRVR